MTTTADQAPAIVRRASATMEFGQAPATWEAAFHVANAFAKSELVPKAFQGRPDDCLIAMAMGAEVGLTPMASLQSIAVINGRPGMYGDGFLGVIMASPAYVKHVETYRLADGSVVHSLTPADLANDATTAITVFWRRGVDEPFTGEFSIADAKRAQLWNKQGPWQTSPARMLKWRARSYAGRDGFAPELRGLRTVADLDDGDTPDQAPAPVASPVRRSEKVLRIHDGATGHVDATRLDVVGTTGGKATVTEHVPAPLLKAESPAPRTRADVQPGEIYPPTPADEPAPPLTAREINEDRIAAERANAQPKPPGHNLFMPNDETFTPPADPQPVKRGPGRPRKGQPAPAKVPMMHGGAVDSVIITDTAFVQARDQIPFYEIRARIQEDGKAPIAFVFVTRDKSLYELASSAEGTAQTFSVTWTPGQRNDGSPCKVLESIQAS